MKNKSLVASVIAVAAMLGLSLSASAAELGKTYDAIIEGAKQEGTLDIWAQLPTKPDTHRAVIEAFNTAFGLETKVSWVTTSGATALARTVAEAHGGGRVTVDILQGSEEEVVVAINQSIAQQVDWSRIFADRFANISELEAKMIPDFKGYALPFFDYLYGIAWNPDRIDASEVPTKLTDLTDPKWKGRFGMNQLNLLPIPIVGPFLGVDESIGLAKRVLENRPILIRGTPAVAQSIVSGAVPVGVTGYSVVATAIRNGEPIRFRLFEDFVPNAPQHLYVPKNSPAPNTAVLFVAWFASEGFKIADKFEPTPSPQDANTEIARMMADVLARGAIHAKLTEVGQLQTTAKVREAITLLMSGQN